MIYMQKRLKMDDTGLKLLTANKCKCTTLLKVLVVFVICIQCRTDAQAGTWFGKNGVLMFHEQTQEFRSTCICYLSEHGSSYNHVKFQLERNGGTYDLCREGYYLSNISKNKALCEPCPNGTYSPFKNACPYCLVCRKCGSNELEVTACSRIADRTCICMPGKTCHIDNPSAIVTSDEPVGQQYSTRIPYAINNSNKPTPTLPCHTDLCPLENDQENKCQVLTITLLIPSFVCNVIFIVLFVLARKKANNRGDREVYNPIPRENIEEENQDPMTREMIEEEYQDPMPREMIEEENPRPTNEISEEHIEYFVEHTDPDEYTPIGIHLKFEQCQLKTIERDNPNDFNNAIRTMLNKAVKRHGKETLPVFLEAFRKSERKDFVEYLKKNCVKQNRCSRPSNASSLPETTAMDQPSTSAQSP